MIPFMTRKILIVSIYLLFSLALIGLIVYKTKPILIKNGVWGKPGLSDHR